MIEYLSPNHRNKISSLLLHGEYAVTIEGTDKEIQVQKNVVTL